jgi:hypothetical protein
MLMRLMDAPSVNLSQKDVKTPVECPVTCIRSPRQQCSIVCRFKFSKIERSVDCNLWVLLCLFGLSLIVTFFDATFCYFIKILLCKFACSRTSANAHRISHSDHSHEVTYRLGSAIQNYPFFRFIWEIYAKKEEEKF